MGVGVAEDLLASVEGGLQQSDGPCQVPRLLVGAREVVAAYQSVGVGVAEELLALGEGGLQQGDGAGGVTLMVQTVSRSGVRVGEAGIVVSGRCGRSERDQMGDEGVPLAVGRGVLPEGLGQTMEDCLLGAGASLQVTR